MPYRKKKRFSKRRNLKRGVALQYVPRNFPPTTLKGVFEASQRLALTGFVKVDASLWQYFAFRNNPDLSDSHTWANDNATGAGVSIPAMLYRNVNMWADFYQRCQCTGVQVTLQFSKAQADPAQYRAYVWTTCDVGATALAEDDLLEPVATIKDGAIATEFIVVGGTSVTVSKLELSRRVRVVHSYVPKDMTSRVNLDISFWIPFSKTRRGLTLPRSFWRESTTNRGTSDLMTVPIANRTSARYGYRNQVNVAILDSSKTAGDVGGTSFFDQVVITTKIGLTFLDRTVIAAT